MDSGDSRRMIDADLRQELRGIRLVLERIATALDTLAIPQEPALIWPKGECPHPQESRIDFGVTNGHPDWQCKVCGYQSINAVMHG
jgi:hypothetical protein